MFLGVVELSRNRRPISPGTGGRIRPEQVIEFTGIRSTSSPSAYLLYRIRFLNRSGRFSCVPMMKTTDLWNRDDLAHLRRLNIAWVRAILPDTEVGA